MEIVITQEDTSHGFNDCRECALATAIKRALNLKYVHVGTYSISEVINGLSVPIGEVHPAFEKVDFDALKLGQIKEFKTEFVVQEEM